MRHTGLDRVLIIFHIIAARIANHLQLFVLSFPLYLLFSLPSFFILPALILINHFVPPNSLSPIHLNPTPKAFQVRTTSTAAAANLVTLRCCNTPACNTSKPSVAIGPYSPVIYLIVHEYQEITIHTRSIRRDRSICGN